MIFALTVAIGLLGTACGTKSATSAISMTASAASSPRIVAAASIGRRISSGRPTVLLFMATGCESCAAEAKALASAVTGRHNVNAVGVDVAGTDDAATLRSFLTDVGVDSLPVTWTVDVGGGFAQRYDIKALSATVGISDGRVRFTNAAGVPDSLLRAQVASL